MNRDEIEIMALQHGMTDTQSQHPWNDVSWQKDFKGGPSIEIWRRTKSGGIILQVSTDYEATCTIATTDKLEVLKYSLEKIDALLSGLYPSSMSWPHQPTCNSVLIPGLPCNCLGPHGHSNCSCGKIPHTADCAWRRP